VHPALGLALAYLAGSIPAAYIAGKVVKGIDLRQHGSGNLGATNVLRVLGAKVAAVVLAVDATKGALPVLLFPRLFPSAQPELWAIGYGVAAVVGHIRPVFLLGKGGGKGVATAAGVCAALMPIPFAAALAAFLLVVFPTRYVSLGSMVGAAVLPVATAVRHGVSSPYFALATLLCAFVLWTHRANMGRLRRGEESRLSFQRTT
jgi:glycerol-3-phosphate acyltransferase PlsY